MATYRDEIKAKYPQIAADIDIAGTDTVHMPMMIKALSLHSWLNTPEETARLAAAKRVLKVLGKGRRR